MNTLVLCAANKYGPGMGGASLQGCRHDLSAPYRWVHDKRYVPGNINVVVLADEQDTAAAQEAALREAVRTAGAGEWVWYHDSSHGCPLGIVCYDSDWSDDRTFMSAQKYGEIFAGADPKAKMFATFDACEFGDSLRSLLFRAGTMQPRGLGAPSNSPLHPFLPRIVSNLVTIAGCQKGKTCADVSDPMGAYGAFTHDLTPNLERGTVSAIVSAVNTDLASGQFEQRAVSTGPDWEWLK